MRKPAPMWLLRDRAAVRALIRGLHAADPENAAGWYVSHVRPGRWVNVRFYGEPVCRFTLGPLDRSVSVNPQAHVCPGDLPVPTGRGWVGRLIEAVKAKIGEVT